MATKLPVDFEERVKRSKGKTTSDYPYAIKAEDLMRNFVYGALDVDESLIEETNGQGGHKARKLAIPAIPESAIPAQLTAQGGSLSWAASIPAAPTSGFFVLASITGVVQWVETEACEE
jgi:hypothetical protein